MALSIAQLEKTLVEENFGAQKLNDFFKIFQDSDILNIVKSVAFDVKTQRIIVQLQKLVKEETERVDRAIFDEGSADATIARLSEQYEQRYPELLSHFKEWRPCREKLIQLLRSSSRNVERSSTALSGFQILTSTADIAGTLLQSWGKNQNSWADYVMGNASIFGVCAVFMEMTFSKKILYDVKKAIKKDQEIFKKITEWFQQTEELDKVISSVFPYGIDCNIVKKINASSMNFDDYSKLFMAILTTNVEKDPTLFKNKDFLSTAEFVASSEAGKQWFHKVVLAKDPFYTHCLNTSLCSQIRECLDKPPTERACYVAQGLLTKVTMKIALNMAIILSAGNNILFGTKPDVCESMEDLAEKSAKELEGVRKIVRLFKPTDLEIDPI